MLNSLIILTVGFALVLFIGMNPRMRDREFKGRGWMLFRALFPSWRFFENLDEVPRVRYRLLSYDDDSKKKSEEWQEAVVPAPRSFGSIFLNPKDGLRMASQSLVEQFMTDVAELPKDGKVEALISYDLVLRLVRYQLRAHLPLVSQSQRFQFKVVSVTPGINESMRGEDLLLSAIHEVGPNE